MKFKVGDIVKIRDDLTTTGNYGSFNVVESMLKYKGKTATIIRVINVGSFYDLDIDDGWSAWTDEMLEPVEYVFSLKEAEELTRVIYADGGLIPTPEKPVPIEKQLIKDTFKDCLDSAFGAWLKLGGVTSLFHENTISIKEDKPMAMFTFSTEEGYRIDKTNNTKIPTITTKIVSDIGVTTTATCDKENYDERQGVIEALANYACRGDFDKQYRKAVKIRKLEDEVKRTCKYCGKTFNTIEEKEAEEAWHVERRKSRHERYLLRKRAKQIAFEEAA